MPISRLSNIVTEGRLDIAVIQKIFYEAGILPGNDYSYSGIDQLKKKIDGFNKAAKHYPCFALCDLDDDECAPKKRSDILPTLSQFMCFRIAVREIEAWLMADRDIFAEKFSISRSLVPRYPDQEMYPKRKLIKLSKRSRSSQIREGLPPSPEGGRKVGGEYNSIMTSFIQNHWSPERAKKNSDSLLSAWNRCQKFAQTGSWY